MPKVEYSKSKGLVQKAGSGFDNDDLGAGERLKHKDSSTSVTLKAKRELITIADDTTAHDTEAGFIPAKSLVVACSVSVTTASAGGNTVNITDLGLDGDPDYFNPGNFTAALNTAGSTLVGAPDGSAAPIHPYFAAADKVRVTVGDPGTQTTDGVVEVVLYYYDLSMTSATASNNS